MMIRLCLFAVLCLVGCGSSKAENEAAYRSWIAKTCTITPPSADATRVQVLISFSNFGSDQTQGMLHAVINGGEDERQWVLEPTDVVPFGVDWTCNARVGSNSIDLWYEERRGRNARSFKGSFTGAIKKEIQIIRLGTGDFRLVEK